MWKVLNLATYYTQTHTHTQLAYLTDTPVTTQFMYFSSFVVWCTGFVFVYKLRYAANGIYVNKFFVVQKREKKKRRTNGKMLNSRNEPAPFSEIVKYK